MQWMATQGQIAVKLEGDTAGMAAGGARADKDTIARLEGQLAAQLEETAAYRAYVRVADAQRLVNSP
jgi:hypothetical protein